jgi:hypothetical protein
VDRAKGEEGLERHFLDKEDALPPETRRGNAFFCLPMSFIETPGKQDSLRSEPENACTKVQVIHSWYREKEAKTEAKVEFHTRYLFCVS